MFMGVLLLDDKDALLDLPVLGSKNKLRGKQFDVPDSSLDIVDMLKDRSSSKLIEQFIFVADSMSREELIRELTVELVARNIPVISLEVMYYLYFTVRPTNRDFSYIQIYVTRPLRRDDPDRPTSWRDIERHLIPQFTTSERANLLKLIRKYILDRRQPEHVRHDRIRYPISEQDLELLGLLVKRRKDYPFLRRLLKMDSRDDVVLELELGEISDAILNVWRPI
jgi:hypothetical protein